MSSHFTVLWPNDYCRFLQDKQQANSILRFVWGGHNLETRFSHFKVLPGDWIYPLQVLSGVVYVVAGMRVSAVVSREEYSLFHPKDDYLIRHDCATEVLIGEAGMSIRFDRAIPSEMLERWKFQSQRGERTLLKHMQEGKLRAVCGLQGVYRLSPAFLPEFVGFCAAMQHPPDREPDMFAKSFAQEAEEA